VRELLGYVFSPLRRGNIALYRGSGTACPDPACCRGEETSLGCVERLEHDMRSKPNLTLTGRRDQYALTRYNDRMTLVLEDPAGRRPIDCLADHWRYRISEHRDPLAGASAECMRRALFIKTSSRQISWWTRQALRVG